MSQTPDHEPQLDSSGKPESIALTRAQVREVDRLAIQELCIPGVVLMENAGIHASDVALGMLQAQGKDKGKVAIICGGGNNGGDGYVIARHLYNAGHKVVIYSAADPGKLTGDAAVNREICQRMGKMQMIRVDDAWSLEQHADRWALADVLVDAVLGTGFDASCELKEQTASVIDAINRATSGGVCGGDGPLVLAVDVPSGLDCDTGQGAVSAVRADATVTFVARKRGFDSESAGGLLGEVFVAGIGIPPGLVERVLASA